MGDRIFNMEKGAIYIEHLENQVNYFTTDKVQVVNATPLPPPAETVTPSPARTPPLTPEERTRQGVRDALCAMGRKMQTDEMKDLPRTALWQGVYRVLADRGIVKAEDYAGFGRYINALEVEGMTLADNGKGLSKTDDGVLRRPLAEWDRTKYKGNTKVFDRFYLAATTFDEILTACMKN
jgi:hypothetical protein